MKGIFILVFKMNCDFLNENVYMIFSIYILLVFEFFGYSIIGYGFIPEYSAVIVEVIVYMLFLTSLLMGLGREETYKFDLGWIFSFFILIAIASAVNNHTVDFGLIYSLRLYLRFYLLYIAIINFGLSDDQLKKIMDLIFFLLIIQIPVQLIKFSFLGISEDTIGSYALHGGGITPAIAIIGLAFSAGYYRFYTKFKVSLLLLGVFFVTFGVLGDKRIILYLYPLVFLFLYYLLYMKQKNIHGNLSAVIAFIVIMVVTLSTGAAILKFNRTLNPEKKVGGSIDLRYAFEYSKEYEGNMLTKHSATGRYNTLKIVCTELKNGGFGRIMFGFGPGSLTSSIFGNERHSSFSLMKIAGCYGQTGLTHVVSEYGLLNMLLIIYFFIISLHRSWRYYNTETDPYWKGFSVFCLVFVALQFFIFVGYNTTPLLNNTLSPIFYCTLAVLYLRSNELRLNYRQRSNAC